MPNLDFSRIKDLFYGWFESHKMQNNFLLFYVRILSPIEIDT